MSLPDQTLKDILVKNNLMTSEAVAKLKPPFIKNILDSNLVDEQKLGDAIASFYKVPFVDISRQTIDPQVAQIIPEKVARRVRAIAFYRDAGEIKVAMEDPGNKEILNLIAKKTNANIVSYFAFPKQIDATIGLYKKTIQKTIDELLQEQMVLATGASGDAPIAKMVDEIISGAYEEKASDIHIEPQENESLIRFRIDGVLQDVIKMPLILHERIVSRIKVLSNLRTDEHLSAQDGKMQETLPEEILDIRVSVIPVSLGEKIVLRLLSSHSRSYTLEDLGMNAVDLEKVARSYNKSFGMILSTGPTGSGKTTTIYAMLKVLNTREKNVTTIEDPVEYRIMGANQVQVNTKTNLTFANGLRSILRQDPNIIFVGEIRDNETAGIAVNAALTGHLVLSTLHTNNAATAIPRLSDMQVEPFLVASTVNIIIAQRLIRQICNSCKEQIEISFEELDKSIPKEKVTEYFGSGPNAKVYHGLGCKICHGTGYQGRIGIFEVLEMSKEIRKLVVQKADADIINDMAIKLGMKTMLEDGLEKIAKGLTTIEEVLRATKVESS